MKYNVFCYSASQHKCKYTFPILYSMYMFVSAIPTLLFHSSLSSKVNSSCSMACNQAEEVHVHYKHTKKST